MIKQCMISVLLATSALSFSATAANLIETENLVTNGLFADQDGNTTGNSTVIPPEWQNASGGGTLFIDVDTIDTFNPEEGGRFFYGGSSAYNSIYQDISLADADLNPAFLGSGLVTIHLGGTMWTHNTDDARMRVFQVDADGNYVGVEANTLYTQINTPKYYETTTSLHQDAVSLRIFLDSDRDYGSDNNGYIYNPEVSLTVEDNEYNRQALNIDSNLSLEEAQTVAKNRLPVSNVPLVGGLGALLVFAGFARRRA